jgi:molecular chaperone IbpA
MFHTTTVKYAIDVDKLLNDSARWGIGMDEWIQRFATANESSPNYPPYNYVKESSTEFRLEFALAGYKKDDIEVSTENNKLFVESKKVESSDTDEYLHKGLAKRAFTWSRTLSDDVKISDVKFENGMLIIKLNKIIPEHQKKKVYEIVSGISENY